MNFTALAVFLLTSPALAGRASAGEAKMMKMYGMFFHLPTDIDSGGADSHRHSRRRRRCRTGKWKNGHSDVSIK